MLSSDDLNSLNLPIPDKAGSRTDDTEDISELESGLKAEDKHIRDARYRHYYHDDYHHVLTFQVPALLRHLNLNLNLLHWDLNPRHTGVHPQQVGHRPGL